MNINPMELIQSIKGMGNPAQYVMGILEQSAQGNPFMGNILNLVKNGETQKLEAIARNTMKEQGKDFDKEFASFKKMLGIK